jgi:hypothetical protein
MPTATSASATAVLVEAFSRTPELVATALDGLSHEDLVRRVDPDANSIAWLVWHTARMQDGQTAMAKRALGREDVDQVWTTQGFADRFGLDVSHRSVGYGMSSEDVAKVRAPAELLQAYHSAVNDDTIAFLDSLDDENYDTVVDRHYDPPVTLMARLVSIEQDAVQHLGQAAYVRGVLLRT